MAGEETKRALKGPEHTVATTMTDDELDQVDQFAAFHGIDREEALGRLAAMGSNIVVDSTRRRLGCR